MKRAFIISIVGILLIVTSLFIYNRYKTKRIDRLVGASQIRIEEYLNYPNELVVLDEIDLKNVDNRIKKIINSKNLKITQPILRYTLNGDIRKQHIWLMDQGEGYYVIEAIDTNK